MIRGIRRVEEEIIRREKEERKKEEEKTDEKEEMEKYKEKERKVIDRKGKLEVGRGYERGRGGGGGQKKKTECGDRISGDGNKIKGS